MALVLRSSVRSLTDHATDSTVFLVPVNGAAGLCERVGQKGLPFLGVDLHPSDLVQ